MKEHIFRPIHLETLRFFIWEDPFWVSPQEEYGLVFKWSLSKNKRRSSHKDKKHENETPNYFTKVSREIELESPAAAPSTKLTPLKNFSKRQSTKGLFHVLFLVCLGRCMYCLLKGKATIDIVLGMGNAEMLKHIYDSEVHSKILPNKSLKKNSKCKSFMKYVFVQ